MICPICHYVGFNPSCLDNCHHLYTDDHWIAIEMDVYTNQLADGWEHDELMEKMVDNFTAIKREHLIKRFEKLLVMI